MWLKDVAKNPLYANITLEARNADLYPDDDILPGLEQQVVHDTESDVKKTFDEETAGIDDHPALNLSSKYGETDQSIIFLEQMGVSDPESVKLQGRSFTASALQNLVNSSSDAEQPDLVIHRSPSAVSEYNNPNLFPGMYPTLYPFGISGFEIKTRLSPVSFQSQADYCISLVDLSFRYHHSFLFVIWDIIECHMAHLQTYFTIKSSCFNTVAEKLVSISSDTLTAVANHLENDGTFSDLQPEQKNALELLKEVNTIAAKIPGSQASKLKCRNTIQSYSGLFGIPILYFTANPNAAHSPLFQVMYGDKTVDLDQRFPVLASSTEQAIHLSKDPVSGADMYDFSINALFEYLFGWDFKTGKSSSKGGILGHIKAFYGTTECTERGGLHGHFLFWLQGALNPSDLHKQLKSDKIFEQKVFKNFEGIIKHHLPDVDIPIDKYFEPRTQWPPHAPLPCNL